MLVINDMGMGGQISMDLQPRPIVFPQETPPRNWETFPPSPHLEATCRGDFLREFR